LPSRVPGAGLSHRRRETLERSGHPRKTRRSADPGGEGADTGARARPRERTQQNAVIRTAGEQGQNRFPPRINLDSQGAQRLGIPRRLTVAPGLKHREGNIILGGENSQPRVQTPRTGVTVEVRKPRSYDEQGLPRDGRRRVAGFESGTLWTSREPLFQWRHIDVVRERRHLWNSHRNTNLGSRLRRACHCKPFEDVHPGLRNSPNWAAASRRDPRRWYDRTS
jgi:hypothetical protein